MTTVSGLPFDLLSFSYHFVGDEQQQRCVLTVTDTATQTFTQEPFGNDPFTVALGDAFLGVSDSNVLVLGSREHSPRQCGGPGDSASGDAAAVPRGCWRTPRFRGSEAKHDGRLSDYLNGAEKRPPGRFSHAEGGKPTGDRYQSRSWHRCGNKAEPAQQLLFPPINPIRTGSAA